MSIDVNVQNDLVIVTETTEDIVVNVSNAAGPAGPAGANGVGVPIGGATGQVLKKFTNTNYDTYWAADASGLTSVGLSMPSGFTVSNSPLTDNGTISVIGAGTTSQYLRGDGSLATFPSIPSGTVTSVGLSMPSAFAVTNSPVTSAGTLAVTGAGTASQYVRGDGELATFPNTASGGSSVNYYLNGSIASSVTGYKQMANTAVIGLGTDFNLVGNGLIAQFLTDAGNPNRVEIPGGAWNFEMYFSVSSSGGNQKFYVELLKYNGSTFTSIATGSTNPEEITGGTATDLYLTSLAVPTTSLLVTDRLAIRVYIVDNSIGRTITLHTEDNNLCEILTTFAGGIAALNGLTANTQYLATGTSGTDFNISSLTDTHTFNLPTASATNRGALSSADWSVFNSKVGGSGVAGQVAYWNGTNSQTGSNNLFWDAANSRLGIGTATPAAKLHVDDGTGAALFVGLASNIYYRAYEHIWQSLNGTFERMRIDPNGNLGLGVTPSAWFSVRSVFQIGQAASFSSSTNSIVNEISSNAIIDATATDKYIVTNFASRYRQNVGQHQWFNAPSGTAGNAITFTQAMTLTSGGNLLVGTTTDSGYKLDVNGTARVSGSLQVNSKIGINSLALGSLLFDAFTASAGTIATLQSNGASNGNILLNLVVGNSVTGALTPYKAAATTSGLFDYLLQQNGNGNAAFQILVLGTGDAYSLYNINGGQAWSVGLDNSDSDKFKISGASELGTSDYLTITTTGAATFSSSVTATSFIKSGGTSSQYLMADGSVTTGSALTITNRQTASYTLALTDADKLVEMNVATANNLTIPLNSSIAFPVGTKIDVSQYGAGQTTVVATGGVTVRSAGGALKIVGQYSAATLVKIATDEWYLIGNITT